MRVVTRYLHFFKLPDKKREYFARKLVGFSTSQMYKVVADVKNYKKFVPFCTKSVILSQEPSVLRANLEVGFPPVIENYTSVVSLREPELVSAVCKDGRLFHVLETTWKFSPGLRSNPQSCIIDFYINFEFKSALYSKLAIFFFDQLVHQMEDAFIKEAQRRYGKESLPVHPLEPVRT
ncbi:coenzyme Q-binding protein COQ10 homolog B, mitochondrial isoform X1 [Tribolium castaneum]|uniref:Coenzyme Q-binding protein COQ10, mitochondrial-like Protein n=2 Tax=Tribolium castaneum TaxID=7070 RepID=D6X341_TRICA|nr:PREDICTED: coenzyme Q-binding protein COQ10 homolog B, mitochondrial isoform X1 [Tribolium castaneum]EFA10816.2 Coenzyme Q-binding protein COQ10, mitochondrial-like Protein [Tribolium castaneum]|eukprot:XP_970076.1 PREDICTED: coenzyme Q-binding protein COQ10 homolog B, mitochondrial isoform X1 [Tribolium castaneum]